MCDTKEFYTFRVNLGDGRHRYIDKRTMHGNSTARAESPLNALAVDTSDIKDLVRVYQNLVEDLGTDNVKLVKVMITVCEEEQDVMNDGDILDERRRVAFGKLSTDDVEALGLQNLATYNKLKFHKADSLSLGDLANL